MPGSPSRPPCWRWRARDRVRPGRRAGPVQVRGSGARDPARPVAGRGPPVDPTTRALVLLPPGRQVIGGGDAGDVDRLVPAGLAGPGGQPIAPTVYGDLPQGA